MVRPPISETGGMTFLVADWVAGPLGPKSQSVEESNPHALHVAKEAGFVDGILGSAGVTHDIPLGREVRPADLRLRIAEGSLQRQYRLAAQDTGLVIPIWCFDAIDNGLTPVSPEKAVQDLTLERWSEAVDVVSSMRDIASKDGSVDPSLRLAFFGPNRITSDNIDRTAAIVKEMAAEARAKHVRVEVETDMPAQRDVMFARRTRRGNDNVGLVVDSGNVHKENQGQAHSIQVVTSADLLDTYDIKDNTNQRKRLLPRKLGSSRSRVDLQKIVDHLGEAGWQGNVVNEQISHRCYRMGPPGSTEGQEIVRADLRKTNRTIKDAFATQAQARRVA